jgi:hypothetical protein
MELFFKGKEVGGHAFEVVFTAAEEHHLVGFFLLWVLVLYLASPAIKFSRTV